MTEQDPNYNAKVIAFYSATVEAWVNTRMEKDRTLLSLAAGGIGLLATLLTTVGPASPYDLALSGLAALFFIVTIVTAICVFNKNGRYLDAVIQHGLRGDDAALVRLDRVVFGSFLIGVVLTAVVGLSSGYSRIKGGSSMAHDGQETTRIATPEEIKSLTGIGNLAPQRPVAAPAPASAAAPVVAAEPASVGQPAGEPAHGGAATPQAPGAPVVTKP
jgi:hypothetical protein